MKLRNAFVFLLPLALLLSSCVYDPYRPRVAGAVVYVADAPPPPKVIAVPARPVVGAVWIPGRWTWNSRRYVWRDGYWNRRPKGKAWRPGRWHHRPRGWVWIGGTWAR